MLIRKYFTLGNSYMQENLNHIALNTCTCIRQPTDNLTIYFVSYFYMKLVLIKKKNLKVKETFHNSPQWD